VAASAPDGGLVTAAASGRSGGGLGGSLGDAVGEQIHGL